MYPRPFWIDQVKKAWRESPIVWLSGVRRVGKTTLCRMIEDTVYLNCDLPSLCRQLHDPEMFYDSLKEGATVVFDEVHRVDDPSRLLKIAADAFPTLRVLATGSSTLAATRKFRDALTGRKREIRLSPVLWSECREVFGAADLDHRLLHGGLPEPFLSRHKDAEFFSDWLDSFYARDIQELFAVRNRTGFMSLLELLLRQSGGLLDYSSLARSAELSRPTVKTHIEAMSAANAVFLLPPYHGGGRREITRRPKIYAFDTGFVTFVKGWERIREEDRGVLWEHLVLDLLRARIHDRDLFFWRDKSGRKIDFVIRRTGGRLDAVECKVDPDRFDPKTLAAFRSHYPKGANHVASPAVKTAYTRRHDGLAVRYGDGTDL